jgi:hypothetical protein
MRSVAGSSGAASVVIVLRDWKHWLHIEGRDKERHVRAMRKVSSLLTILLSQKLFAVQIYDRLHGIFRYSTVLAGVGMPSLK